MGKGERHRREEEENGEDAGEDEGGSVLAITVSAADHAWFVEGSNHQNSPQGHRQLDQRHSPPRSSRRHLHVIFPSSFFYFLIFYSLLKLISVLAFPSVSFSFSFYLFIFLP